MSDLTDGMRQAADVLADASIKAFWDEYDRRMSEAVRSAGLRISPETRLKGLLNQALIDSVQSGWIDVNTFAYQSFVHSDPLSVPEVFEFLLERLELNGVLTTTDLTFANEIGRQVRARQRQPPKRSWFSRFRI